jgi:hypothetical protein
MSFGRGRRVTRRRRRQSRLDQRKTTASEQIIVDVDENAAHEGHARARVTSVAPCHDRCIAPNAGTLLGGKGRLGWTVQARASGDVDLRQAPWPRLSSATAGATASATASDRSAARKPPASAARVLYGSALTTGAHLLYDDDCTRPVGPTGTARFTQSSAVRLPRTEPLSRRSHSGRAIVPTHRQPAMPMATIHAQVRRPLSARQTIAFAGLVLSRVIAGPRTRLPSGALSFRSIASSTGRSRRSAACTANRAAIPSRRAIRC